MRIDTGDVAACLDPSPWQGTLRTFYQDATRRKEHQRDGEETLERTLSLMDLVVLGVGGTLGSGLFLLAGRAAREIAGPAVTISFAAAAVACVFSGLSYAEMSSRIPACGGAYSFVYSAVGEFAAFLVGMCLTLEYGVSSAAVARAFAAYVGEAVAMPGWMSGKEAGWCAVGGGLMLVISFLIALGIREALWVVNGATAVYAVVVAVVIGVGIPNVDVANWSPFVPNGGISIVTGASAVFFSYIGFDEVAVVAEEAKDAARAVPLAILVSLFIVAFLYIAATFVLTGMVNYTRIDYDAPFPAAFRFLRMPVLASMIGIGVAVGMVNTALVGLLAQSRIFLAMGQDGLIPRSLGENARRSTVVCGGIVSLLALGVPTKSLTDVVSGGTLLAFLGTNVSLILTRYKLLRGDWRFGPWLLYVYVVGCLLLGFTIRLHDLSFFGVPLFAFSLPLVVLPAVALGFENLGAGTDGEPDRPAFKCSYVPVVPLLGVLTTAVLFSQLSHKALGSLGAWLSLSSIVYCMYGRVHSEASSDSRTESVESAPLL